MTDKTRLPDLPSELIRAALADVEACEEAGYTIDMRYWHSAAAILPSGRKEPCTVCLAGAVMAQSLGIDEYSVGLPNLFGKEVGDKLYALSCFKDGRIAIGLEDMGLERPLGVDRKIPITRYDVNRNAFFEEMDAMAAHLEREGL